MRIILLAGNQANQLALASKISKNFNLVGIILEEKKSKRKITIDFLFSKLIDRILFYKISSSWKSMLQYYKNNTPQTAAVPTTIVEAINSKEVLKHIEALKPDLIMVSGTSMIKEEILQLAPPKGIINLHTGLSPYVKGGPNCTNWCIANNTVHLIGNTIMWLDKGIDSGNIITTDLVNFTGNESLDEIHIQVMEHAHALYIKAIYAIKDNFENCPSVKQSEINKGTLFFNRMWNFKVKLRFTKNIMTGKFKKNMLSADCASKKEKLTLIKLPQ